MESPYSCRYPRGYLSFDEAASERLVLALLGLSATAGVAAAGLSLHRALAAVRTLVSVGTAGTSALRGIEEEAQRSRRAVLDVLAAEDSAGRQAHSAEARGTDARIALHFQELMDTDPSSACGRRWPPGAGTGILTWMSGKE